MIGPDLVRAAATAAIVAGVVTGRVTLVLLIVAAVVGAAVGAVSDSAQAVAVRHVVPSRQLPAALAQNEARGHLAGLTGQPAGGYLYALGTALPVLADALSYLASAVLAGMIRQPLRHPPPTQVRSAFAGARSGKTSPSGCATCGARPSCGPACCARPGSTSSSPACP